MKGFNFFEIFLIFPVYYTLFLNTFFSTPFGQPPMNNMMYGGGGMMPNGAYGIGGASQQPPQQQWNAFGGYNNVGGGLFYTYLNSESFFLKFFWLECGL